MLADAKRLLELEAKGFEFSRNKNFRAYEEDPELLRVHQLRQRLETLVDFVDRYYQLGDLEITTEHCDAEEIELRMRVRSLALDYRFRMHPAALQWLRAREAFARALAGPT